MTKLLINYLNHITFYQAVLWLLLGYITKGILQSESIVFAEGFTLPQLKEPIKETVEQFWGLLEPDGNITCEEAAYNERNPSNEDANLDHLLNEDLTTKRIAFIDTMVERIHIILNYQYPNGINIPEDSIKNATYIVLNKYGNLSDWMANTEVDIKDPLHELNVRLFLIQRLIEEDTLPVSTTNILAHMATCIQMINSAHVLDIPTDKIESNLLKPECYDELYKRYKN